MAKFDIDATRQKTMQSLKDFQWKTVERIGYLFEHGQKRVLVADEVGLGKTLIARGAIVKTAELRLKEGDNLLRVAYICSNTAIASQNIQKLNVTGTAKVENISDTRLSMLHLKIQEQETDEELRENYIQLIPLTPGTSFQMTNGGGTVSERALMFAVLSRMDELMDLRDELERLFIYGGESSWGSWAKKKYEDRVAACEAASDGEYPRSIIEKIRESDREKIVLSQLKEHLLKRESGTSPYRDSKIINALRVMFARISTQMLEPDLVIMDEFQRFKFLLASDQDSDIGILAQKFLGGSDTRILLLSATPYKLYSTLEEIDEARVDEHYSEFLQVMDFLFAEKKMEFHQIWSDYSVALHELTNGDTTILQVKNAAENAMYAGVCRTERISVMDSGDYTDESKAKNALKISEADVKSYLAAGELLHRTGLASAFPVDYVKSCPFLMSFMKNYKVKDKIEDYFNHNREDVQQAADHLLWLDRGKIRHYEKLPETNIRLQKLKEEAFAGNAENYLWVPPSRPYYALQGAYRNGQGFSKILVFSSWEMVPRMIGSLISYEAERLTIGGLADQTQTADRKKLRYDAKRRYPYPRLGFRTPKGVPQSMSLFCLLYPSATLAALYDPIAALNANMQFGDIEKQVRAELRQKLAPLKRFEKTTVGLEDAKWYYLAPMLMDGEPYVRQWIAQVERSMTEMEEEVESEGRKSKNPIPPHMERLKELLAFGENLELGKMPEDLLQTLTDMVLGSPAVCICRSNDGNTAYATFLAKVFVDYLNTTESTAVVELTARKHHKGTFTRNAHWQNVLLYCKDGCFQSMLDEYFHLIEDSVSFSEEEDKEKKMHEIMMDSLRLHTAQYKPDTFEQFQSRVCKTEQTKELTMRGHYAVGFVSEGDDDKKVDRKNKVRAAFNSPLRPFVLASTSIGQEGLDFHNYCRKIVHWNLPSNPIDLEQREGRINRYKCLAIRQNVALKYGNIPFVADVWKEMFAKAQENKQPGQSDLVPFWCFGKDQTVKIERIVPMYPMSKDQNAYDRLMKILSLYRITLGQARQEELLEYLFRECEDTNELKNLFMDLSPYSKGTGDTMRGNTDPV